MRPFRAVLAIVSVVVATTYVIPTAYALDADVPFRSIVPNSWKLLPRKAELPGRRFVSPAGDAWLWYFAVPVNRVANAKTGEHAAFLTQRVTYARRGGDWFVSSGYRGDSRGAVALIASSPSSWRYVEHMPPDVTASTFWLKNRDFRELA